jgi:hypothetical protein
MSQPEKLKHNTVILAATCPTVNSVKNKKLKTKLAIQESGVRSFDSNFIILTPDFCLLTPLKKHTRIEGILQSTQCRCIIRFYFSTSLCLFTDAQNYGKLLFQRHIRSKTRTV